jgi:hypothetical protein
MLLLAYALESIIHQQIWNVHLRQMIKVGLFLGDFNIVVWFQHIFLEKL